MSSNVAFLTCLVDITLRSPTLFWMTTCLSELKSTIFQSRGILALVRGDGGSGPGPCQAF